MTALIFCAQPQRTTPEEMDRCAAKIQSLYDQISLPDATLKKKLELIQLIGPLIAQFTANESNVNTRMYVASFRPFQMKGSASPLSLCQRVRQAISNPWVIGAVSSVAIGAATAAAYYRV
jgi:hypothetical protein